MQTSVVIYLFCSHIFDTMPGPKASLRQIIVIEFVKFRTSEQPEQHENAESGSTIQNDEELEPSDVTHEHSSEGYAKASSWSNQKNCPCSNPKTGKSSYHLCTALKMAKQLNRMRLMDLPFSAFPRVPVSLSTTPVPISVFNQNRPASILPTDGPGFIFFPIEADDQNCEILFSGGHEVKSGSQWKPLLRWLREHLFLFRAFNAVYLIVDKSETLRE